MKIQMACTKEDLGCIGVGRGLEVGGGGGGGGGRELHNNGLELILSLINSLAISISSSLSVKSLCKSMQLLSRFSVLVNPVNTQNSE